MKRLILGSVIALAACEGGGMTSSGGGGGMREFMVIGGRMTFEDCRARGGLIIRDSETAMVACDPSIRREPVPADEFDHPDDKPAG
ncbi:hypothetical protein C7964_103533 [Loktanella sp. PT4BL]|jgi:hypothetical protein|uniref:hypothetical protein n=1 Tax=Loktanella sp. PT4BL TaxID=2135611 RepID=UPI000D755528|nr:hypothetical protein [Loktanella sp. PT4BL]PXW69020.1 hypothetical protein C7964_103533 [Loktanella sp. PT4BL]